MRWFGVLKLQPANIMTTHSHLEAMSDATLSVSVRVGHARALIRQSGKARTARGMLVVTSEDERFHFGWRGRDLQVALENLDKQPCDAFRVFVDMNHDACVKELRRLPFYHLV